MNAQSPVQRSPKKVRNANRNKAVLASVMALMLAVISLLPLASPASANSPQKSSTPVPEDDFCDDEVAPLDQNGNVIFPPDLDTTEPVTYEEVEFNTGNVSDIYEGFDTTTDTWYKKFPCDPSIGGTIPPDATNPDLTKELTAAGITGATPQEISDTLNTYQDQISNKALKERERLKTAAPAITTQYTPPAEPHCVSRGCKYVFGGRDLVFVHGLRLDPLFDKIFGTNAGALTTWPANKSEFYGNGYWKRGAEAYWNDHVKRFLKDRGIMNRYLIIAYASTQRLEVGVQAILTQIGDAMISGTGVVDPSVHNDTTKFGTPSYVVISHSTGGPATDIAMSAASQFSNLQAQFIPQFCKAHVALNAVFSGSTLATAAVAISTFITILVPPVWLCPLANQCILALNELGSQYPTLLCSPNLLAVATSILVDLVPLVMQLKWGKYVKSTPVRTVTVIGSHPSYIAPFKYLIHMGFDDGVSTINSQVANPNSVRLWPSGFDTIFLPRVFDMGVARTYPIRAIDYFRDQARDHRLNTNSITQHPFLVAAGATPYVSPTGMLQPVSQEYSPAGGFNPLRRSPNHFSFIQSAADHFGGSTGLGSKYPGGFNGDYYRNTFGEHNLEETRVITDPGIYLPYTMFYSKDNQPLLTTDKVPKLEEIVRGRRVHFKIKILGVKISKTWWIWKRHYHLLTGWQNKTQMDYVYESMLTDTAYLCPPPDAAHDCNSNGIADDCDISSGASGDCNHNGIPDECENISPPKITQQPNNLTISLEQPATFSVVATGTVSLHYQWRKNGSDLVDDQRISGATTDTLTINPTLSSDAGLYDVTVTGSCRVVSVSGSLTFPPCIPPPNNMIAWYPFDEQSGLISADLMFGNFGTHAGSFTSVIGQVDGAILFDGVQAYVEADHKPWLNVNAGNFSIDAWIRITPRDALRTGVILDKRQDAPIRGYHLIMINGTLWLQLADAGAGGGFDNYNSQINALADGKWHLIAVTVDRNNHKGIRWYLDGLPAGAISNPKGRAGSLDNDSPLRIGRRSVSGDAGYFKGAIDELEIFNRVLSPPEIKLIFQAGSGGKCKIRNPSRAGSGGPPFGR